MSIGVLGFLVWSHHMYSVGLDVDSLISISTVTMVLILELFKSKDKTLSGTAWTPENQHTTDGQKAQAVTGPYKLPGNSISVLPGNTKPQELWGNYVNEFHDDFKPQELPDRSVPSQSVPQIGNLSTEYSGSSLGGAVQKAGDNTPISNENSTNSLVGLERSIEFLIDWF